ncbi:U-box domain-containing protein 33 isoform 1 [Dorcoceras hygrometricum]|uniref:U-box domain-containing protein 33 isoform 1 n=1 Tax=Dorcoceras hygrometricum TaxID=472368 RepID=A0A2Z7D4U0_9LAMI|nr:U-box domain-containing protein 33 isoform 1 [Dorcoceras hygrometricum]
MAPSVPRTRAAAALRMKQIALDNQDRTIRRLRDQLATESRGLAATKKELKETQVALEASHKVIAGLTEIGLSMSKKIEKMKVKKQLVTENHVECHQKFQARIHEAEDSMKAQHLINEALVDEKDSLLQTIHGLQEANNAPAPFDGDWEEEPEEESEEPRSRRLDESSTLDQRGPSG